MGLCPSDAEALRGAMFEGAFGGAVTFYRSQCVSGGTGFFFWTERTFGVLDRGWLVVYLGMVSETGDTLLLCCAVLSRAVCHVTCGKRYLT